MCSRNQGKESIMNRRMFLLLSLAMLSFGHFPAGWAQSGGGDTPACSDFVSGTDTGCADQNCNTTANCTSYTFTAACTARYEFDVWTTCSGSSLCYTCRACAFVYKDGRLVGSNCHAANCEPPTKQCYQHCTVDLEAGTSYQLWVCLNLCPEAGFTCADCGNDCTAHACLALGQIVHCWQ